MRLAGNAEPKISPKCHLRTIAQLCRVISSQLSHASTIGKKLLNSNIFSRCFDNIANSGPLTDDMGCRVWSTSANFKRFRVLALLLQQPRSPEGDQTLHDAWPSPRLVHYLYIFSNFFAPDGILPGANFTLRPSLAFSYIGNITARHSTSGHQPNFAGWYKEWN